MKRILFTMLLAASLSAEAQTQTYETEFARPLNEVLTDIQNRFGVRLKYDIDTVGKVLSYADFRIRPYSVEESLTNVLAPFDYKFVKQKGNMYKLKAYEYPRRTDADGEKMLAYLNTLYTDQQSFQLRADSLKKEVRQRLGIDTLLAQCVKTKPILSKIRKFDGYTVQNFALETLPGLYICGSIYTPQSKGKHALIICPNGHFGGGRYREDQQQRMGTLARMGAVCVDYDLFGWGESALQVGSAAHRSSAAHTIQAMNGLLILDYMLASRKDIDTSRIGANGGSGGGMLLMREKSFETLMPWLERFLPRIDNWATCDLLKPVCFAKNREKLLPCVTRWLGDAHPYTVRFAIEMLMTHYLREDFSPEYPAWVAAVESDHYYIRMMQAWYFATALAFRYEEILPYLTEDRLSPWVRQKTIQKAVESFRVPPEHKAELKALRR